MSRPGPAALRLALAGVLAATFLALPAAATAGVRQRIVAAAQSQIGYHDHGYFCTKFGPCELWCSLFSTWAWRRAGVPISSFPFTGSVYVWARAVTYVRRPGATPRPGDMVLFGTGPRTVSSSRHVGVVEAVYPGWIVTIEGDVLHAVRRFVVPTADPQRVGEPGPIYAYASPVPAGGGVVSGKTARAAATPRPSAGQLRAATAREDKQRLTPTDLRLRRTIRALRAFQHMPYRTRDTTIRWTGVDRRGRIDVLVRSPRPLDVTQRAWRAFLERWGDAGGAYVVTFDAPPPATTPAPPQQPPPDEQPPPDQQPPPLVPPLPAPGG